MHYAVHGHTAAELIYERADADKPHMGLTTWAAAPEGKIVKSDVSVAKNYLSVKTVMIEEMNAPEVTVKFDPVKARYVRFQGIQRNNKYGYSIYDANILVKQ